MSIFGFQRSSLNLQHFFLAFTKSIGWGPAVWLGVHWQVRCGGSSLSLQISSIAITAITDRGKRSYGLAISEDLRRLKVHGIVHECGMCIYIYNYTLSCAIMYYHVLSFIQPKTISVWIHVGSTLRGEREKPSWNRQVNALDNLEARRHAICPQKPWRTVAFHSPQKWGNDWDILGHFFLIWSAIPSDSDVRNC